MTAAHSPAEPEVAIRTESYPCPAPTCDNVPPPGDRYCTLCGTWLGLEGEAPPTTGPLQRAINRTTGALKIASIIERAEASLNELCK